MPSHYPLMVPGAVPADAVLEVSSPYDGRLLATVETVDRQGVDRALETASRLFRDRSQWMGADRRIDILKRLASLMAANAERLITTSVGEGGKPLLDTRVEMERAIDGIHNCIDCIRNNHGEEIPMGINAASLNRLAVTHHEPVGVVVAVSAFNHPLNLIVHQIGPAIASGCPVIVKPAEDTPLSCHELVALVRQAGLPEEWCQVVSTDSLETATAMVTDPRIAFFSFIGSARVGWMLRSKLAPGVRCALEHGGAAPVLVAADANLDDALPLLAKAGFYHAGQVCVSTQRVYAHHDIVAAVADGLAAAGRAMHVGDPVNEDTDVGPLIRPAEVDRVHAWVQEAVEKGAQCLCGGQKLSETCYPPTVLLDPPEDAKVSRNEIFGPVICVYTYDDIDDAIRRANSLDYAFQAAVFTQNIDTAMHAYRNLDASSVMINDHTAFRVDWMPFAGLKQSGLGVGGIPHTFEDMQIRKMMLVRSKSL